MTVALLLRPVSAAVATPAPSTTEAPRPTARTAARVRTMDVRDLRDVTRFDMNTSWRRGQGLSDHSGALRPPGGPFIGNPRPRGTQTPHLRREASTSPQNFPLLDTTAIGDRSGADPPHDDKTAPEVPKQKSFLPASGLPLSALVTDKSPVRHVTGQQDPHPRQCDRDYPPSPPQRDPGESRMDPGVMTPGSTSVGSRSPSRMPADPRERPEPLRDLAPPAAKFHAVM